jgi:thioredoxin-related protein
VLLIGIYFKAMSRFIAFLLVLLSIGLTFSSCKGEREKGPNPAGTKSLIPQSPYAMLIVESESCIYCKQLDKDLQRDPQLKKAVEGMDVLRILAESNARVKYRLDGKEGESTEEELARALGVSAYPHIIFYNSQGNIILRLPGYTPPKTLACVIRYVKEEFYKKENINQFLQRERCV